MSASDEEVRVVCICIYYDENPQWLGEHLASLAPVCRDFVYVDGAYALFPGAFDRPTSPPECSEALHLMARACNRDILHYRPSSPFYGNEVEKRNMSLDLARTLPDVIGNPNVWFLVADADTVATKVNDALPKILAQTDYNVGEYGVEQETMFDPAGSEKAASHLGGGRWEMVRRAEIMKPLHVRSIYRNLPGLRYGPAHWNVTHGLAGRERSWLWGGNLRRQEGAIDLSYDLRFEHRRQKRQAGRNADAVRYYDARDIARIEA